MVDEPLAVSAESAADGLTVRIVGELDDPAVERLRGAFDIPASGRVGVDLSGVTFMSSAGVNWLVGLHHRCDRLLVENPSVVVIRVLDVTGLTDVLAIVGMDGGRDEGSPLEGVRTS